MFFHANYKARKMVLAGSSASPGGPALYFLSSLEQIPELVRFIFQVREVLSDRFDHPLNIDVTCGGI